MRKDNDEEVRRLLEELRANMDQRRTMESARLEEARRTSAKEPFDFEALLEVYDPSLEHRDYPITDHIVRSYEYHYYVESPEDVRTIAQFGEHLYWLHTNDAG